jgi:hypothetical protein
MLRNADDEAYVKKVKTDLRRFVRQYREAEAKLKQLQPEPAPWSPPPPDPAAMQRLMQVRQEIGDIVTGKEPETFESLFKRVADKMKENARANQMLADSLRVAQAREQRPTPGKAVP